MSTTLSISEQIRAPILRELDLLEAELARVFTSDIGLISAIGEHLMSMKGKRIRPALVLLAARIGDPDTLTAIRVAAAVEIIHTATLLHDDSIDRSHLRRGLPTVNNLWNDQVSVVMGDYLFCKAFRILHEGGLYEVASVLSTGSDNMTYGEMFQMDLRRRYDISEETYLRMIKHKTAALFASACEAGAIVGGLGERERSSLKTYGESIGIAFQIVDDILDFIGDVRVMGKPVGNDLKDGRVTLPLIVALRNASRGCAGPLESILDAEWTDVVHFIKENGGIDYAQGLAEAFVKQSIERISCLKPCPAINSLTLLAQHVVSRKK
jgi:octaprenyl-diphosphate synthase